VLANVEFQTIPVLLFVPTDYHCCSAAWGTEATERVHTNPHSAAGEVNWGRESDNN